jgi:hypothetical protein
MALAGKFATDNEVAQRLLLALKLFNVFPHFRLIRAAVTPSPQVHTRTHRSPAPSLAHQHADRCWYNSKPTRVCARVKAHAVERSRSSGSRRLRLCCSLISKRAFQAARALRTDSWTCGETVCCLFSSTRSRASRLSLCCTGSSSSSPACSTDAIPLGEASTCASGRSQAALRSGCGFGSSRCASCGRTCCILRAAHSC